MRPGHVLVLLALMVPASAAAAARARDGGHAAPRASSPRSGRTAGGRLPRGRSSGASSPRRSAASRPADGSSQCWRPSSARPTASPPPAGPGRTLPVRRAARAAELGAGLGPGRWSESPVARAALAPVRDVAAALEQRGRGTRRRAGPPARLLRWPDLEIDPLPPGTGPGRRRGAAEGIGPDATDGAPGAGRSVFLEGRPHPDRFVLSRCRAAPPSVRWRRGPRRCCSVTAATRPLPRCFATYLVSRPAAWPLVALLEPRLDRDSLVRSFVGGPARRCPASLPPALGGPTAPRRAGSPARGSGTALLLYAADRPAQRAVARAAADSPPRRRSPADARSARTAEALDRDWRAGQGDLALRSVLLPPAPAAALAVVLELAGDARRAAGSSPPLGALSDAGERAARTPASGRSSSRRAIPVLAPLRGGAPGPARPGAGRRAPGRLRTVDSG